MKLEDAIQYVQATGGECRAYLADIMVKLFEDRQGNVTSVWQRGVFPVVERGKIAGYDPVLRTLEWEIADVE
jgi:hypothetical protein